MVDHYAPGSGSLQRLERNIINVIAHGRHCGDCIVAAVGGLGVGIAVDIGLDAVVEGLVAAFCVEGGNEHLNVGALGSLQDHVVIPRIGAEERDADVQGSRLGNELRGIRDRHGCKEHVAALILRLVQVGAEVGVVLREGVGDDGAAGLLKCLLEEGDQALVILVAVLAEAVGLLGLELGRSIVGKDSALERIQEADAEVVAVAGRNVRVRTRHADGRDVGLLERVGRGDGHAGAVGTEHEGNLLIDELGSRRDSLRRIGTVVGVDELDLVGLAADLDGRGLLVGILHAEHFLLAAGAGVAAGGLEHADLNDLLAVVGRAQSADKCPSNEYDGIILSFCKKCNINFTKYSYQNFEYFAHSAGHSTNGLARQSPPQRRSSRAGQPST